LLLTTSKCIHNYNIYTLAQVHTYLFLIPVVLCVRKSLVWAVYQTPLSSKSLATYVRICKTTQYN